MNNIARYTAFVLVMVAGLAIFAGAGSTTTQSATYVGCHNLETLYIGQSIQCGNYVVEFADLGQPNANGIAPAVFNVYFKGVLTNITVMTPPMTRMINDRMDGAAMPIFINLEQTTLGLYANQKTAVVSVTRYG